MESEHLAGGSGGVWRICANGVTRVHRPTGPWTPAVHALLEHLHERGLPGIPRVHGIDAEGREVLDYLPGDTLDPETTQPGDAALADAAAWLRKYHDAVRDFRPGALAWRQGVQALEADEIICHNDPGLYNWVVQEGEFAGMIDWDRAGPGRPLDDLAFLVWSGVPLLRPAPVADVVRRLQLVAVAYGGVTATAVLDAVDARMALIAARWQAGIERGDPGTLALRDSGAMGRHLLRVREFGQREVAIRHELAASRENPGKEQLGWSGE
ncbi:phosphotransferase [Leucobacter sp. HY1908]